MLNKSLIIIFVIIQLISYVLSQNCNLPNGQKSICIPFSNCEHFAKIIRSYGRNNIPVEVRNDIRNHLCTRPANHLCCPDNAEPSAQMTISFKNHPNINKINSPQCGQSSVDRIVGGMDAQLKEVPWLALLGYTSRLEGTLTWGCGGALISPNYVLTAAHCTNRDLTHVRLGEHTISTEKDCDQFGSCNDPVQDIPIQNGQVKKHPNFNRNTKANDIALLKLVKNANLNQNNIRTICLPVDAENDIETILKKKSPPPPMTISGFGRLGNGKLETSDVLQVAYVPFVNQPTCFKAFKDAGFAFDVHKEQFCAGVSSGSKIDNCKGDSGGPITNVGNKGKIMLYGVVVGGDDCDNQRKVPVPGVYTDVRYYLQWILDNLN